MLTRTVLADCIWHTLKFLIGIVPKRRFKSIGGKPIKSKNSKSKARSFCGVRDEDFPFRTSFNTQSEPRWTLVQENLGVDGLLDRASSCSLLSL